MSTAATARDRTPSLQYRESGRRQVEKDEARALRAAMEDLDLKAEQGLYESARDEAAELVWKHQNPDAPGANPDAPYSYPGLARKASIQRSQSLDRSEGDLQRANSKLRRKRNSMQSMGSAASGSRNSSLQSRRAGSGSSLTANAGFSTSPTKQSFGDKAEESATLPKVSSTPSTSHRKTSDPSQKRRSSSSRRRVSASLFKNPDDQIYEEPEEDQALPPPPAVVKPPAPAKVPLGVRRNPFARVQFSKDRNIARSNTDPIMPTTRFDRFEIQRNPPSQSRNAGYTRNSPILRTSEDGKSDAENDPNIKIKDGKEVRSEELRAATGFKLKDRSAKLPTPTMVSDSPGRPIVSFQNGWKPREIEMKEEISTLPGATPRPLGQAARGPRPLSKAVTEPVVPTISTATESSKESEPPAPNSRISMSATPQAPSIRANRAQVPAINVFEDPPVRPLPSTTSSRKVNTPPQNVAPTVPTINVSQAPPARSKPSSTPPIPKIAVQETPSSSVSATGGRFNLKNRKLPSASDTPVPSISVSESSTTSRSSKNNNNSSVPTISVSDSPASYRGSKVNAPSIPTISVSESPRPSPRGSGSNNTPSISVTPSVPSINVDTPPTSTRPLPVPNKSKSPFNRTNNGATSRSHWTPTTVRSGALCEQCALPIAGRIVSAAGVRFHPECFLCHHCGEHLECVAFYPEPANKHEERVARIQARQRGDDIPFLDSHPTYEDMQRLETEDGPDEALRFYCHLDFHEMFSPRCKSCKTPIEGEVVVACGAEWHVGHFFCAQCGDPFDSSTPFVEKEGYAWCVGCHTNRYSTKCRKCRKPVIDTVVKALGAEWHVNCFVCMVSYISQSTRR